MSKLHWDVAVLKERLWTEFRKYVAIFVYLSVFFSVFRLYTQLILTSYGVDYYVFGLSLLKSLVLAKVVLTAEMLQLGERFQGRPLIIPTLYKAVVFSIFALAYEVAEHLGLGALRGKGPAAVLAEIQEHGWRNLAGMTLVVFVSFIPFFAFRETERVFGEGKLLELFFRHGPDTPVEK